MEEKKYLSLEDFLSPDSEKEGRDFMSTIWKNKDGTPGLIQYRIATMDDHEAARQAAKPKEDIKFDNATFAAHLIARCLLIPKIPPMEVVRLRGKHAAEMDRLQDAILEKPTANPR